MMCAWVSVSVAAQFGKYSWIVQDSSLKVTITSILQFSNGVYKGLTLSLLISLTAQTKIENASSRGENYGLPSAKNWPN